MYVVERDCILFFYRMEWTVFFSLFETPRRQNSLTTSNDNNNNIEGYI